MRNLNQKRSAFHAVLRYFFVLAFVAAFTACSDNSEVVPMNMDASSGPVKTSNPKAQSYVGDYGVSLAVTEGGTIFTYTITKARTNAKTLGHFIINLDNCPDETIPADQKPSFDHVEYATVNGQPVSFSALEGSGTLCAPQDLTSNFLKIDGFTAASSWVVEIGFDRGYQKTTTTGWTKAGVSCNTGAIEGPGCPVVDETCFGGKGNLYTAANDAASGKDAIWAANGDQFTVGVDGIWTESISKTQASAIWYANDRKKTGLALAVLQLGAIDLRNLPVSTEIQTSIDALNGYLAANACSIVGALDATSYSEGSFNQAKFVNSLPTCFSTGNIPANVKQAMNDIGKYVKQTNCDTTLETTNP